jgi:DNA-binding MarR family transcriptional regulator
MDNLFSHIEPEESTSSLLWQVTNLWQQNIKGILKKYSLNHTQFVVLGSAVGNVHLKTAITQMQIGKQVNLDKMVTSNSLRALEKKGFIKRSENKLDTRAKTIKVTKKGITHFETATKDVDNFDHSFFSSLKKKSTFNNELLRLTLQKNKP